VVVVGGKAVVGTGAESALSAYGPVERLWGDDQFDTQLAVYSYGAERGLWGATAVVASGSDIAGRFADALSASPVAFKLKAPVFLVDDEGNLPDKTKRVLVSTNDISQVLVAGGSTVVSNVTEGFMQAVTLAGGGARNVSRAAGETLYDTSFEVARWAVENGILNWDNVAFATSIAPYDALAGSVLQGKRGGVLLVAGQGDVSAATKAGQAGANVKQLTFMGGSAVIKPNERVAICDALGIVYLDLLHVATGISLSGFANIEVAANAPYQGYSLSDIMGYMDPGNWAYDDPEYYQFAVLSDGYSGMSAEALDAFISRMCRASERSYGVVSNMRGTGAAFVEAAKTYNINEVYLVCHAALESAWGCSKLAQGSVSGYEGYLNFYGIGAYDIDPNNGGAALAKKNDWSSPDVAILGAAKWISQNYVHPSVSSSQVSGAQNTLWRMRWDVRRAIADGTAWHQYATAGHWATSIANLMSQFYDYHGIKTQDTGLRYEVPQFQ
jgi:beta-N-acetylglucosaminidase